MKKLALAAAAIAALFTFTPIDAYSQRKMGSVWEHHAPHGRPGPAHIRPGGPGRPMPSHAGRPRPPGPGYHRPGGPGYHRPPPPRHYGGPGYGPRYHNGYRGYSYYRPGYRNYDGWWYPAGAFAAGALIGGAVAAQPSYSSGSSAHVNWCYNRWRSYRASDNTYQPSSGPRRECVSPYS